MSEELRQSLSALMDNEADELEMRRTLKQLDGTAAAAWGRYHIVGSVLKGEPTSAGMDVSQRVMDAIESEPAYRDKPEKDGLFWKPLASVAVAASVTAMVIFGAQSYQGSENIGPALVDSGFTLPGPAPVSRGLLPAQYGNGGKLSVSTGGAQPDVIRLSYGLEHYINQHNALLRSKQKSWSASWLPDGFTAARHEVMPDSEVMVYSNGRTAISVCVEPYGSQKSSAGVIQSGDTVALGKRVGGQFVTVVGQLPLMMADRIASSVSQSVH